MKAYVKSLHFTNENPEKAAADLQEMVPDVDPAVAAAQIRDTMTLVFNDLSEKEGLGVMTPERVAKTWTYVAEANELAESSLDPEVVVNREFIPE
jgi:NitT/TauT family transport system substrate-binding protein